MVFPFCHHPTFSFAPWRLCGNRFVICIPLREEDLPPRRKDAKENSDRFIEEGPSFHPVYPVWFPMLPLFTIHYLGANT